MKKKKPGIALFAVLFLTLGLLANGQECPDRASLTRLYPGLDEPDVLKRLGANESEPGDDLVQYPTNASAAMVRRGVVAANWDSADTPDELACDFGANGIWSGMATTWEWGPGIRSPAPTPTG